MSHNNGSHSNPMVLIEERELQATFNAVSASGAAQETSERPEGRHSQTRLKKLLPLLVLPIVVGACWYGYVATGYESTDDAQVQGHVMQCKRQAGCICTRGSGGRFSIVLGAWRSAQCKIGSWNHLSVLLPCSKLA